MILNDQKDAKELLTKNPKTKILTPPPHFLFLFPFLLRHLERCTYLKYYLGIY